MLDPIDWNIPYTHWVITLVVPNGVPRWHPFETLYQGWVSLPIDALFAKLSPIGVIDNAARRVLSNDGVSAVDIPIVLPQAQPFAELFSHLDACLHGVRVDWHITPIDAHWPREKRLLISDMDSTLLEGECIDELAAGVGLKDAVAAITARAMCGELDFETALRERVALLEGLSVEYIHTVLDKTPLMQGATTLATTMRARGAFTVIVSGGFVPFTEALCEHLNMHDHQANRLEVRDGVFTGNVIPPILGQEAKYDALQAHLDRLQLSYCDALAIGDGANDLKMLLGAGLGVAYHAKPTVQAESRARIRFTDLRTCLYFQGIPQNEWVNG